MASLFDLAPSKPPRTSTFPEEIQQALLALKAEHPPLRINELAPICFVRFDRRPDAKTIRKVLAEGPFPSVVGRRFPRYRLITDPVARRLAIVRLHTEGWNIKSIAAIIL